VRLIVDHKPVGWARRFWLALVAFALTAFVFVPAGAAQAAPVYGVSFLEEPPAADFKTMGQGGVQVVRTVLSWADVQPTKTSDFKWHAFDRVVANAARAGVQVLPILYGVPSWAVDCGGLSQQECRRVPPIYSADSRAAWQKFVNAAVERYGPNGTFWSSRVPPIDTPTVDPGQLLTSPQVPDVPSLSKPPYTPITRWQVWNEPSSPTYWKPGEPNPKQYARLVKLTDETISAHDSSATVLLAGLFGTPFGGNDPHLVMWRYLSRFYKSPGIADHFDAVALHPYAPNIKGIARQVHLARGVMARNGDADKPLWITEIGWGSADPSNGPLLKGPDGQAAELGKAFRSLSNHESWGVAGILWFDWRDPGHYVDGCTSPFCLSAGLLNQQGNPKPSWSAFAAVAGGTP
jgi:Beta-galactosidase/Glycosyl hydrolase catalytic core